jgi:L-ascorbate metabolism protein UlaG (beta-lactamase superfamily)
MNNVRKIATIGLVIIFLTSCTDYYDGGISDHFDGKRFYDPEKKSNNNSLSFIKWIFIRKAKSWPKHIDVESYDIPPKRVYGDEIRVSNVGHVTFLIQTQGINILTDPAWSKRASPFGFIGPKRVIDPGIKFEDLPDIDLVWVSHNHYDHLDLPTLEKLWNRFKPRIITPLGNDAIIHSYNKEIIVEAFDWGDSVKINDDIQIHLSPMQHWSRRGLFDRNKALWAALTIVTKGGNIYFIGDSGYGDGRYFKRDKTKFGKYRLVLMPMGAFEPRWFMKYSHMDPEEFVLAHIDLGKPFSIPSHYDVFKLTDEGRGEATIALRRALKKHNVGKNVHELKVGEYWFVPEQT